MLKVDKWTREPWTKGILEGEHTIERRVNTLAPPTVLRIRAEGGSLLSAHIDTERTTEEEWENRVFVWRTIEDKR